MCHCDDNWNLLKMHKRFKDVEYKPIEGPDTMMTEYKDDSEDEGLTTTRQRTSDVLQSEWQSQIFQIKRKSVGQSFDPAEYYKYRIFLTTKWIIVPLYILFGVATVVISIFYFIHDITQYISFGVILGINIVGGVLGAIFVYRFGTIEMVLDFLSLQNKWYDKEMDSLKAQRQVISKEAKNIHFKVHKLKV